MSNPLDTKIISRLAEILDKTNLTELEYEDEGCRNSLVRNPAGGAVAGAYAPVLAPIAAPAAAPAPDLGEIEGSQPVEQQEEPAFRFILKQNVIVVHTEETLE